MRWPLEGGRMSGERSVRMWLSGEKTTPVVGEDAAAFDGDGSAGRVAGGAASGGGGEGPGGAVDVGGGEHFGGQRSVVKGLKLEPRMDTNWECWRLEDGRGRGKGEGEEGGVGFPGEVAEALPGGGGDAVEFDGGGELEVEEVGGHLAKCSNKHHWGGGRCKEEEGEPRGRRACDRDGHATVGEVRLRRRDFGHDRDGSCHGGVDR